MNADDSLLDKKSKKIITLIAVLSIFALIIASRLIRGTGDLEFPESTLVKEPVASNYVSSEEFSSPMVNGGITIGTMSMEPAVVGDSLIYDSPGSGFMNIVAIKHSAFEDTVKKALAAGYGLSEVDTEVTILVKDIGYVRDIPAYYFGGFVDDGNKKIYFLSYDLHENDMVVCFSVDAVRTTTAMLEKIKSFLDEQANTIIIKNDGVEKKTADETGTVIDESSDTSVSEDVLKWRMADSYEGKTVSELRAITDKWARKDKKIDAYEKVYTAEKDFNEMRLSFHYKNAAVSATDIYITSEDGQRTYTPDNDAGENGMGEYIFLIPDVKAASRWKIHIVPTGDMEGYYFEAFENEDYLKEQEQILNSVADGGFATEDSADSEEIESSIEDSAE